MKKLLLLCLLIFPALHSCDLLTNSTNDPIKNTFLAELVPGQQLYYILLHGQDCREELNFAFSYSLDTLVLEVLEVEERRVLIREYISAGSNIFKSFSDYYWGREQRVYENEWTVRNDSLFISGDSHLLFRDNLPLKDFDAGEVDIIGWKPAVTFYEGDSRFIVKDYTLWGRRYDKLNIFINNRPMAADGNGNTSVYSRKHGIVRSSIYFYDGQGWDRIK